MEEVWVITWKRNGVVWKMYRGYVENVWGDEDTYLDHMGNTGII